MRSASSGLGRQAANGLMRAISARESRGGGWEMHVESWRQEDGKARVKCCTANLMMCAPPITNRRYSRLPVGATGGFPRQNENRLVAVSRKRSRVVLFQGTT